MKKRTGLSRLGLMVLPAMIGAAVALSAQTPAQQANQPATFKAGAYHVSTNVKIFSSKDHQFISDLKPAEFQVFEDGVLQKVADFSVSSGGRLVSSLAPPPPVATEGLVMPPPPAPAGVGGRIFVIFVDDMHLQPADSAMSRRVLQMIRDTLLHSDDLVAIVSTGFTACESNSLDYDLSHHRINECIDKLIGAAATPNEILNMTQTATGLAELHHRIDTAFRTAYGILDQLEAVTTKTKAFIWVSSGYDLNPFTQSRLQHEQERFDLDFGQPKPKQAENMKDNSGSPPINSSDGPQSGQSLALSGYNPFSVVSQQFSESDLISKMAELIRSANRANTSFYAIDPRGLSAGPVLDAKISTEDWTNFVEKSVSTLQVISDQTGGFATVNTNDFAGAIRKIDNATSDYYVLGWYSNNPDPLRKVRKIDIKTTRPGVTVEGFKTSYSVKLPPAPGKKK